MPGSYAVELQNVTVVRDGATLLHDLSWAVSMGQKWAVIGPNGAGKTTLLRLLATEIHPTSGSARVLGEALGKVDVFTLRPRIGVSSRRLAERLPRQEIVRDVVVTGLQAVVGRWRESYDDAALERANDLLDQLGIGALANRRFASLSDGERQRVAVARALMPRPDLLLLDEPAAGLDLGAREDLVARVGAFSKEQHAAVVLVTHHLEEIPANFDHVLLLRSGSVISSGEIGATLTSKNLTACFSVPLLVNEDEGRWTARRATAR